MFNLEFTTQSLKDLKKLEHSEPSAHKKALKLLEELRQHPSQGTGKPERLRGSNGEYWSRRINSRHRLTYAINDDVIEVLVVSAYGHYGDK